MSNERIVVATEEIRFEHSATVEGYQLSGFGCSLCPWTTKAKQLFEALPEFAKHNNTEHLDTFGARLEYVYKKSSLKVVENFEHGRIR